jgi:hypothetical protein
MNTEKIKEKYHHYGLEKEDVFKHQHYLIITRSGIDKIQAMENIVINYDVINCEANFCVVKATANKGEASIQTFWFCFKR